MTTEIIKSEQIEWTAADPLIKPERKGSVIAEKGKRGGIQYRNQFANPLDFYVRRKHITRQQYRAGCKLFRLWHWSCLRLRYTRMGFGEMRGGVDLDTLAIAPREYLDATKAISDLKARMMVIDVCCHGKKAGKFGGVTLLCRGLDDLAAHFGIEP